MTSEIQTFQSLHRIAVIGVSHDRRHFSRAVYRAWRDRDYELVPVNPTLEQVEGDDAYDRPQEIPEPVDAALILTPPAASPAAVKDALDAGIRIIWLYRSSPAAEALATNAGATLISGECPLMYLPQSGWIHRAHRWIAGKSA